MRSLIMACLLAALPFFALQASEKTEQDRKDPTWWINLGMGPGSNFNSGIAPITSGGGSQLSFNGRFTPHGFLTLYLGGFQKHTDEQAHMRGIRETGVMYGYIKRQPSYYWSASSGLCAYAAEWGYHIEENYYSSWGTTKEGGLGIPVQAQAFWTPFKHFGLGLVGHSMVAGYRSSSVLFALQVF